MEFVRAISPPICERSYEHVPPPCQGQRTNKCNLGCPFCNGRSLLIAKNANFFGPSAARNLIFSRTPSRFSNLIFVSYNLRRPYADALLLPRNEKLLADPVRLRQITERIPAARWGDPIDFAGPIVFLASRASQYVCGEILVVDGVRNIFLPLLMVCFNSCTL